MSDERSGFWKMPGSTAFFCGGIALNVIVLGPLNFIASSMIDYQIAAQLGGVTPIPQDGSIFPGGLAFGGIDWTWSSMFGPLISIFGAVGLIAGFALTGLASWLVIWRITFGSGSPFGRYAWLLCANLALWLLRYPLPTEYSLFYWAAIRY